VLYCKIKHYKPKERNKSMAIQVDKFTVTFYDEEEIKIADEFRAILIKNNVSINDTLKNLIKHYIEQNS
jgi:hypothetical protein